MEKELDINIINISITGALVELCEDYGLKGVPDLFEAIRKSPILDFYIPDMKLAGDANVARAEEVDGRFQLALEFNNLSSNAEYALYKRHVYRKNLIAPGQIVLNGKICRFESVDVSVDGLMIRLAEKVDVKLGTETTFEFKRLDLNGEIKVIWVDHIDEETLMGVQYINIERGTPKGIPRFETK